METILGGAHVRQSKLLALSVGGCSFTLCMSDHCHQATTHAWGVPTVESSCRRLRCPWQGFGVKHCVYAEHVVQSLETPRVHCHVCPFSWYFAVTCFSVGSEFFAWWARGEEAAIGVDFPFVSTIATIRSWPRWHETRYLGGFHIKCSIMVRYASHTLDAEQSIGLALFHSKGSSTHFCAS